jgi:Protease II
MTRREEIFRQIDLVLEKHAKLRALSRHSDLSDLRDEGRGTSIAALMADTIRRLAPAESQYVRSVERLMKTFGASNPAVITHLVGILSALRDAYENDLLVQFSELVHAEIFSDFIEMAEHLLQEGYKDPAAVVIGSVLEEHLRQLCVKNGVNVDTGGKPKKADQLNAELAGNNIYNKLDQKSVTSWLDLRNKAAHGQYGEYTKEQVSLILLSVQDFMGRIPA